MSVEKHRQSNIELLRILAAGGVILLHYNNAGMGGGFLYVKAWSINQLVMMFFESIFVCAVNLFVLISGYFMAEKKTADLLKPLSIILQVIVYALAFYVLLVVIGSRQFSLNGIINCFIPNNWFIILYAALFVISPYINKFIGDFNVRDKINIIIVLGIVFCLLPTLADALSIWTGKEFMGLSTIGMYGSQDGYTIVNFIIMYMVGNVMRDIKPFQQKKQVLYLLAVIMLIFAWALLDNALLHEKHSSWAYCNPLVVIEAILVFQIFRNIKIEYNRIINRLAAASLSVYIFHTKVIGKIGIEHFVNRQLYVMIGHILLSCIAIYFTSWVTFEIYSRLISPLYNAISTKWKKHRFVSL